MKPFSWLSCQPLKLHTLQNQIVVLANYFSCITILPMLINLKNAVVVNYLVEVTFTQLTAVDQWFGFVTIKWIQANCTLAGRVNSPPQAWNMSQHVRSPNMRKVVNNLGILVDSFLSHAFMSTYVDCMQSGKTHQGMTKCHSELLS